MIDFLFGSVGLLIGALVTTMAALRMRPLRLVLLVAFCLRAAAALFHRYVKPLPDGVADAVSFEQYAWHLAEQGFFAALVQFPGYGGGWGYPWLVSFAYALVDRSPLFMQSLSVVAGTLCVVAAYKLALRVWNHDAAIKAAWVTALFPMLIMYSALTMREAFIVLAFLIALNYAAQWQASARSKDLIFALMGFVVAGFFHGPMLLGAVVLLGLLGLGQAKRLVRTLQRATISPLGLALAGLAIAALSVVASGAFSIPYIGTIERGLSVDAWIALGQGQAHGGAAYPDWLAPDSVTHYLMLLPVRIAYFIGSPFPWDVRSLGHLLGLFDGALYLIASFMIMRNLKSIWRNPSARIVLLICVPMIFVYAIGVGNFGTALRHRAKFVVAMIVLAAPLLPGLRLPAGSLYRRTPSAHPGAT